MLLLSLLRRTNTISTSLHCQRQLQAASASKNVRRLGQKHGLSIWSFTLLKRIPIIDPWLARFVILVRNQHSILYRVDSHDVHTSRYRKPSTGRIWRKTEVGGRLRKPNGQKRPSGSHRQINWTSNRKTCAPSFVWADFAFHSLLFVFLLSYLIEICCWSSERKVWRIYVPVANEEDAIRYQDQKCSCHCNC